jgi:hypothetical protein
MVTAGFTTALISTLIASKAEPIASEVLANRATDFPLT